MPVRLCVPNIVSRKFSRIIDIIKDDIKENVKDNIIEDIKFWYKILGKALKNKTLQTWAFGSTSADTYLPSELGPP